MDVTKILNSLIAEFLPALNKALPPFIIKEGLDPWKDVLSGTDNLGDIDLGLCTASAKANYSINNMVGLSSMTVTAMTIDSIDSSRLPAVSGMMSLAARLNRNLSAKLSGSVTAGCGIISETVGLSGSATASGVSGRGNVFYSATIGLDKSCLTNLTLQTLLLGYKHIEVNIDGLGIFNEFLEPLVDAITVAFAQEITGLIAGALRPVLNDLMNGELPFCLSVSPDSGLIKRFPDRRPR